MNRKNLKAVDGQLFWNEGVRVARKSDPFESGLSKSAEIRTKPRALPGSRRSFSAFIGTRRATGRPPLAMVISSPCRTRSTSFEKCVFASWIFTAILVQID